MRGIRTYSLIVVVVLSLALGVLLAGCGSDPTTSEEYKALEQQLSAVTAERDALAAESAQSWSAELPAEAAAALENYGKAVTGADGQAMLNYVTDDFTFLSYGNALSRDSYASTITAFYKDFQVEYLGEHLVLGGGDTYIVAEPVRATSPAWVSGFSVLRLKQVDGVWLVDVHRFTGE